MADQEIAVLTAAYFRTFQRAGRLNSAGRYVLGLTDLQLRDAVKNRTLVDKTYFGEGWPYMGLVEFLFAAAPERLDAIASLLLDPKSLNSYICELMLKKGGELSNRRLPKAGGFRAMPGRSFRSQKHWSSIIPRGFARGPRVLPVGALGQGWSDNPWRGRLALARSDLRSGSAGRTLWMAQTQR